MKRKGLAAFGSHCVDCYMNLEGGRSFLGGGPVNMAVHAKETGIEAEYIGAVGDDIWGKRFIETLKGKGIETGHIHVEKGNCARCEVVLADKERILNDYDEGVLETFSLSEEDLAYIGTFEIAVTDLWGRQERHLKKLRETGTRIALDGADRPEDPIVQEVISDIDILFFSAEKDTLALRRQMEGYREKGVRIVVATLGTNGSLALNEDGFHTCGIVPNAEIKDTMGAGDSYIAGFLCGLIQNKEITEAMADGAALASRTLGYYGAFQ